MRRDNHDRMKELLNPVDGVPPNVTEQLVLGAVSNGKHSDDWLRKLLDAHDDEVIISEQVLIAAMGPFSSSERTIQLLQQRRPWDFIVTDEVLFAAAENCNRTGFETILIQRPDIHGNKTLVDMLVKATVRRGEHHLAVPRLELLYELYIDLVEVTEDVLLSAVSPLDYWRNHEHVHEVMEFFHNRTNGTLPITEKVLVALAASARWPKTFEMILDWIGDTVPVTDVVLAAVAGNGDADYTLFEFVLDRLSAGVKITEKVMMAVVLNPRNSKWMISILLRERHEEIVFSKDFIHHILEPLNMGQLFNILTFRENDTALIDMIATLNGPLRSNRYVERWLQEQNANREPGLRMKKFFESVENGSLDDVKEALTTGVDYNARGLMGRTPLMFAAIRGDVSIVELLLEQDVDVNMIDYCCWTALHWAASYGNKGAFSAMVAHEHVNGAMKDCGGRTAQDVGKERAQKGTEIHPWI